MRGLGMKEKTMIFDKARRTPELENNRVKRGLTGEKEKRVEEN